MPVKRGKPLRCSVRSLKGYIVVLPIKLHFLSPERQAMDPAILEAEVVRLRNENLALKEARRLYERDFAQLESANRLLKYHLDACRETIRDSTRRIEAVLVQARDGV